MSEKRYNSICRLLRCTSRDECDGVCESYDEVMNFLKVRRWDIHRREKSRLKESE